MSCQILSSNPHSERYAIYPEEKADRFISVMLIEDSAIIREALEEALSLIPQARFEGFATTSSEAIRLLQARPFDMVVVDIELAQGTGFDVLQAINHPDYPYPIPVAMMLTNHAYTDYRRKAQELKVKYFYDKSMHFNEAIDTIEQEAEEILGRK